MTANLVQYKDDVLRCAQSLSRAADCEQTSWKQSFGLAAQSTLGLCKCPPAAWGDTPVVIARLLLPTAAPKAPPNASLAAANFWAFHLFALLNSAPTIQRSFVAAARPMCGDAILSKFRKRVNELLVALGSTANTLTPQAGIVMQVIKLYVQILQTIARREEVDLHLFEFIATDIQRRIKRLPAKEFTHNFADMAERAEAMGWEANHIIASRHRDRVA